MYYYYPSDKAASHRVSLQHLGLDNSEYFPHEKDLWTKHILQGDHLTFLFTLANFLHFFPLLMKTSETLAFRWKRCPSCFIKDVPGFSNNLDGLLMSIHHVRLVIAKKDSIVVSRLPEGQKVHVQLPKRGFTCHPYWFPEDPGAESEMSGACWRHKEDRDTDHG